MGKDMKKAIKNLNKALKKDDLNKLEREYESVYERFIDDDDMLGEDSAGIWAKLEEARKVLVEAGYKVA